MATRRSARKAYVPKDTDELLAILRAFFHNQVFRSAKNSTDLNKQVRDRERAWDILTALRGPDMDGSPAKRATTAIIRQKVFGCDSHASMLAQFDEDTKGCVAIRKNIIPGHFRRHAEDAFGALGLSWGKLNGPKKMR